MKISVVIPHFFNERIHNLQTIVSALRGGTLVPDEILIWNNAPFPIDVHDASVVQAPWNAGSRARFVAALVARGDYVLFQDNDICVDVNTLAHMRDYAKPDAIVALEGRRFTSGSRYTSAEYFNGSTLTEPVSIDITLGRMELVHRDVVRNAIPHMPFDESMTMDDIWFSYAASCRGIAKLVIPYPEGSGFRNLDEYGVGQSIADTRTHLLERNALSLRLFH